MGDLLRLPLTDAADMELEDARWVHCAWLAAFLSGEVCEHVFSMQGHEWRMVWNYIL